MHFNPLSGSGSYLKCLPVSGVRYIDAPFFLSKYMSVLSVPTSVYRKRPLGPIIDIVSHCKCWEMNSGPLELQVVLPTSQLLPQPHSCSSCCFSSSEVCFEGSNGHTDSLERLVVWESPSWKMIWGFCFVRNIFAFSTFKGCFY